jgi:hypothetical protein
MESAKLVLAQATTNLLAAETAAILASTKYTLAKIALKKIEDEHKNTVLFKDLTDAIQTIQYYAIYNGISLGTTMDALTERLFRKSDA